MLDMNNNMYITAAFGKDPSGIPLYFFELHDFPSCFNSVLARSLQLISFARKK